MTTGSERDLQETRHFIDRLGLRRIDRDIFTGWCHAGAPQRAFGGQVAAQALVAAGTTVEGDERTVHSLHAYFLRPGRTSDHIVYLVDRPRDGGSFSTRRVTAVQYGETIFMMSASFATDQTGPRHAPANAAFVASVPAPESIHPESVFDHVDIPSGADEADPVRDLREAGLPAHQLLDLRLVPGEAVTAADIGADQMVWVRLPEQLPDRSLLHVCALTYLSDLTLVSTVLGHHGGRRGTRDLQIASIDHAMWFHERFRADEWLLFVTDSPVAGHGHGFARGSFYTANGTLVASVAQEVLVRLPPGEQGSTPRNRAIPADRLTGSGEQRA